MANIDVYFKYDGTDLTFSNTESGNYVKVEADTLTAEPHDNDTVTFHAVAGIDKLVKIEDGKNGSVKLFKTIKSKDKLTIVATMVAKSKLGDIDKYDVKFKPENGNGTEKTVDPIIVGQNDS